MIGGHFRLKVAKDLGFTKLPVVYVTIPELEREKELNLRLNKNLGEWDLDLLKEFDEAILADIGFTSEDLDSVFEVDDTPESSYFPLVLAVGLMTAHATNKDNANAVKMSKTIATRLYSSVQSVASSYGRIKVNGKPFSVTSRSQIT